MWGQEEPQNQGAWYQIQHLLRACLQPGQELDYAGRARSPSPAAGHLAEHAAAQVQLVAAALVNPHDGDHADECTFLSNAISSRTPSVDTHDQVPAHRKRDAVGREVSIRGDLSGRTVRNKTTKKYR